jgi:uncharacterized protein YqfA (UPF0365 family)
MAPLLSLVRDGRDALVVEAQAQVPLALAEAFRGGRLIGGAVSDGPMTSNL